MAGKRVVLYEWPESQECMECSNGQFIIGDPFVNSQYICGINYIGNKDGHCEKKKHLHDD